MNDVEGGSRAHRLKHVRQRQTRDGDIEGAEDGCEERQVVGAHQGHALPLHSNHRPSSE